MLNVMRDTNPMEHWKIAESDLNSQTVSENQTAVSETVFMILFCSFVLVIG